MKNKIERWQNFSKESKILHKRYFELSEELHKILMGENKSHIEYLVNEIVLIEKEIDSLKEKYYESFNNSLYRPQQSYIQ